MLRVPCCTSEVLHKCRMPAASHDSTRLAACTHAHDLLWEHTRLLPDPFSSAKPAKLRRPEAATFHVVKPYGRACRTWPRGALEPCGLAGRGWPRGAVEPFAIECVCRMRFGVRATLALSLRHRICPHHRGPRKAMVRCTLPILLRCREPLPPGQSSQTSRVPDLRTQVALQHHP